MEIGNQYKWQWEKWSIVWASMAGSKIMGSFTFCKDTMVKKINCKLMKCFPASPDINLIQNLWYISFNNGYENVKQYLSKNM